MSLVTSDPSGEVPQPKERPAGPSVRLAAVSVAVGIVVLGVLGLLATRAESHKTDANDGWAGTLLSQPVAKPDFTLTDTAGAPFDFREQTAGLRHPAVLRVHELSGRLPAPHGEHRVGARRGVG